MTRCMEKIRKSDHVELPNISLRRKITRSEESTEVPGVTRTTRRCGKVEEGEAFSHKKLFSEHVVDFLIPMDFCFCFCFFIGFSRQLFLLLGK